MLMAKRPATGKKLKKRLEELERRAGTSDGGSSSGNEKPSPPVKTKRTPALKAQRHTPPASVKSVAPGQYSPPMHHDDEYLFPPSYDERERSHTPPMFSYPAYPPPTEDMMMAPYGAVPGYRHAMPGESYPEYLAPSAVPVTLPPVTHFSDAIKRESAGYPGAPAEEGLPYMNYSGYHHLPGIDINAGHPSPYDQMPHVSASSPTALPASAPRSPAFLPPLPDLVYHGRARC